MLLYISDNKTVEDVQDHFNECFPYLKMEFYWPTESRIPACDKNNLVAANTLIGSIRNKANSGVLEIKSWYKTSRIKQDLGEIFGLNIQIFRLYKGQWIPTSYSDELTLRQQSELAVAYAHR